MIIDLAQVRYKKEQVKKIQEAIEYLTSKGLNPRAYNDVVKTVEGLKFIEELEKKYGVKF